MMYCKSLCPIIDGSRRALILFGVRSGAGGTNVIDANNFIVGTGPPPPPNV